MAVPQDEIITLEITDLARGGAGVGRDPTGRVIFTPFTAPGDRVRVRIVGSEKRYAQGELVELVHASEKRIQPRCPVFGKCGGCQWQHLPYEMQWKTKVSGVQHALTRVGIQSVDRWEELPADMIWEYRNRVQLRGFQEKMGFFAPKSHDLIPISRCEIARPEINQGLAQMRKEGAERLKPYKVEVEVLPSGQVRKIWNSAHAAGGFRQVHDDQNEKLRKWVSDAVTPGHGVLDLYGGSGNLASALTAKAREIHCVDVSAPAERAHGTPAHLHFHRSAVLPWLLRRKAASTPGWTAVLDPPREGLGADFAEIAAAFGRLGVTEIVAVGCDPDAWARDLSRFYRRGWKIGKAAVLDLFPQTPHVESLALLFL